MIADKQAQFEELTSILALPGSEWGRGSAARERVYAYLDAPAQRCRLRRAAGFRVGWDRGEDVLQEFRMRELDRCLDGYLPGKCRGALHAGLMSWVLGCLMRSTARRAEQRRQMRDGQRLVPLSKDGRERQGSARAIEEATLASELWTIARALLTPICLVALIWHYRAGLPMDEVGRRMGLSSVRARELVRSAEASLRAHCSKMPNGSTPGQGAKRIPDRRR